ncbi:MAG: hypothetical protein HY744_30030 [Deltaproteobacteria bacterium]|nr:hypothetical protein [Deltaproteobacteria bacterium]
MDKLLRLSSCCGVLAAAAIALATGAARADIPPPPGYVEQCTVERQQKPGEICEACGESFFREPDACAKRYAGTPFGERCRTAGASVWTELWCRPAAGEPKPVPTAAPVSPPSAGPSPTPTLTIAAPSAPAPPTARPPTPPAAAASPPAPKPATAGSCALADAGDAIGALLVGLGAALARAAARRRVA